MCRTELNGNSDTRQDSRGSQKRSPEYVLEEPSIYMPEKFALFTAIASSQPPDFRPGLPVTNDWLSLDSHNHLLRNLGLKT